MGELTPLRLVAVLLRAVMLVLMAVVLILVPRVGGKRSTGAKRTGAKRKGGVAGRVWWLFCLAALGMLVYQASWQLGGFRDRRLMDFMERHSRRPAQRSTSVARGRVLDVNGLELAGSGSGGSSARTYPHGAVAAHAVGFKHATYGRSGVESAHDSHLRGATTRTAEGIKALGRNLLFHHMIEGNDAVLTLDVRLQQVAADKLAGRRGAVVALDPRTGAIRVMASSPSFDPHRPGQYGNAAHAPLFNRAAHGLYPPGSTFKVLVAAAAIEGGQAGVLTCPAEGYAAEPGAKPIRDHEYYAAEGAMWFNRWRGHGNIDLATALRKSSNVYFAQRGVMLGGDVLSEWFRRFRLDASPIYFSGSDGSLAGKACSLPSLSIRREVAQVSIGQGRLLVTPLHMAMVAGTVAHGGVMMAPQLDATLPARSLGRVMRAEHAAELGRMLEQAVSRGTGRGALAAGLPVAGKTGTAQNSAGADHAWFICYAPVREPRLALAVLVENGGYGSAAAVPVAAAVLRRARELGLLEAGR